MAEIKKSCRFAKKRKMGKIYTKSGDKGTTSLVGGTRISKNDTLLEAYGTCDELNSFIGLLVAEIESGGSTEKQTTSEMLRRIQNTLFDVGGLLATEPENWDKFWSGHTGRIEAETGELEKTIDGWEAQLPPIRQFILPGGDKAIATAHVCRTVCRRLERRTAAIAPNFEGYATLLKYINRLSDFFFILSRFLHQNENISVYYYQPAR